MYRHEIATFVGRIGWLYILMTFPNIPYSKKWTNQNELQGTHFNAIWNRLLIAMIHLKCCNFNESRMSFVQSTLIFSNNYNLLRTFTSQILCEECVLFLFWREKDGNWCQSIHNVSKINESHDAHYCVAMNIFRAVSRFTRASLRRTNVSHILSLSTSNVYLCAADKLNHVQLLPPKTIGLRTISSDDVAFVSLIVDVLTGFTTNTKYRMHTFADVLFDKYRK